MAAALRHPAFVKVFSIDTSTAEPAIVMELVAGRTLGEFLREERPTPELALNIVHQIADAMREAHAAGLVHCDLKPSNLMMEPSGQIRILDFGLSSATDALETRSGLPDSGAGTLVYMAPERILGRRGDVQADIYSLGVVLYELLTGQRPLLELNGLALATAYLQSSSAAWLYPPDCHPALVHLVCHMTANQPGQRLRSMEEVCAQVAAITGGVMGTGVPPARSRSGWWHAPRWRWLVGMGMAAACTLGLAWRLALPGTPPVAPYSEARAMRAGMEALQRPQREGNLDLAVIQFEQILQHTQQHAGALAGLSLAYILRYFGDGRDETWLLKASASAQQAVRLDDQLSLGYAALGWVEGYQGQAEAALRDDERALQLDPRNLFAWRSKTDLLIRMARYDEAEQAIRRATQLYPQDPWFSDCLGKLRYLQGRYAEAEGAFRRSIRAAPDSTAAYGSLSQALLRLEREDEALHMLQQGLQVHADSRLYGDLGTILFARADYAAAAQAFEHAVSADKGSPNLYLNWANLADALRWLPNRAAASQAAYQQAAQLLGQLLLRTPDNVTRQSRMGLYQARLGNPAQALMWSGRALRSAAANAEVHFRAAIVFEVSGDRKRALAALGTARSQGFPLKLIETEPDLLSLRRDLRYHTPTTEGIP